MNILRLWTYTLTIFFLISTSVFPQSNQIIDELLSSEEATFGHVVYLVLHASLNIPEETSIEEAIDALKEKNWKKVKIMDPFKPIKLGDFSILLMRAFDIKGGVMYSIFKSPKYATSELAYMGIITGNTQYTRTISGMEVLVYLGNLLEWKEAENE
jgi:hypothetical protein